jgi:hypothetical protein
MKRNPSLMHANPIIGSIFEWNILCLWRGNNNRKWGYKLLICHKNHVLQLAAVTVIVFYSIFHLKNV